MSNGRTRLDAQLVARYDNLSRATIQKLIKTGYVSVNGVRHTKPSEEVSSTDDVSIDLSSLEHSKDQLNLSVIYEDENCAVIYKPVGVLTHSKGVFNPEPTVASWLHDRPDFDYPSDEFNDRAGIVHRLDRATSGILILAKSPKALGYLQKQFQDRTVKKTYIACVNGVLEPEEAIMDLPIARNPKKPNTFRVDPKGKSAQTHYKVLQRFESGNCLVELSPKSGRTHQLRVHLNYVKHPIIGDVLYGGSKAERLYLHAKALEITIPGGIRKVFTSSTPEEFLQACPV